MAKQKYVDIIIDENGKTTIDQIGNEGKECVGEVDDLIKALGKEISTDKKPEYYKQQKVRIHQQH